MTSSGYGQLWSKDLKIYYSNVMKMLALKQFTQHTCIFSLDMTSAFAVFCTYIHEWGNIVLMGVIYAFSTNVALLSVSGIGNSVFLSIIIKD